MSNTIALIAHDTRIDDLVSFVLAHAPTLTRYQLVATATTGKRLQSATGLRVEQKLTGSLGGDVQIAAEVATGNVIAVIFLVDPFAQSQPRPDILVHLCQVHNVAIATNIATAEAIAVSCNVTKDEDLTNLVERTIDEFGNINILVNNVGGGGAGKESPFEISVDDFARTFQLNVFSAWRLSQLCAPHMKESGYGSIISMSSMSSVNKSPAISAYASSKAAINHMTANLAFDYGPEIRINAVAPGARK